MLTAEPATPKRNAIVNFEEASLPLLLNRKLSLQRELDVVDNLTFICATSGHPENVIALCIEEGIQPNSCTFRIAMNTKVPKELLDGMRAIAQVLEKADSRCKWHQEFGRLSKIEADIITLLDYAKDVESLVTVVMHMNRNRILVRLRSIHAGPCRRSDRTATVRRLQVMVENLKSTASQGSVRSRIAKLQSTANEIGLAFTLLEASNTEAVIAGERDELIIRLLSLLDNLPSAKDLTHILTSYALPRDQRFQGQQDLVNTITKLRKYRASCEFLSKAASATTIFRSITVAEVSIRRSPNTSGTPPSLTTCLRRMNLAWDQGMNNRFKTTLTSLSDQFRNEMANFKPKIHAEIQLLFFYEQYSDLQRPRILCSSKSACFLCNLFVGLHGKFLVRRTHGVLYPKWTLPAVDEVSLCNEARQTMSRLVGQLRTEIQAEICKVLRGTRPKRTHPAESLFSLQFWSASDKSVIALPTVGKNNTDQSVSGRVSQSFSHANQLIRNDDAETDADKYTPVCLLPSNLALETHDVKGNKH